jgi:hypothetical protein
MTCAVALHRSSQFSRIQPRPIVQDQLFKLFFRRPEVIRIRRVAKTQPMNRDATKVTFWPPKPKLLLITWRHGISRAVFGV